MKRLTGFPIVMILVLFFFTACETEEQVPDPAVIAFEVQDVSVYNGKDGAITVNVSQGEPPYYFFWSNGQKTQNVSGLHAGTYTLKMIYGNNGSSYYETSFTVNQPEPRPLTLSFNVINAPVYGRPLGSVTVSAQGGVPPYRFLWETGATTASLDGLFAGTYAVTVRDSGNPFVTETSGSVTVGQPVFECGRDSILDIDGNLYPTVKIGDQCWLAENLRTTHIPDSPLPNLVPIDGRFCQGLFCQQKEGAHYTWTAMMNGAAAATTPSAKIQGICPTGWHLPTRGHYDQLDKWLAVTGNGGSGFLAGAKMKGANSSSGFNALFTGNWGYGVYTRAPQASFWTSTEYSLSPEQEGMLIYVTEDTPFMNSTHKDKPFGLNVRCIKDEELP